MGITVPHIGQLRQSGQLQINTPVQQGAGFKDNYTTLLTCRGRLTELRGSRSLNSAEVNIIAGWEWMVRHEDGIDNISNKKSIRWIIDGRRFTVDSYKLIDQKKKYYRFILLENE